MNQNCTFFFRSAKHILFGVQQNLVISLHVHEMKTRLTITVLERNCVSEVPWLSFFFFSIILITKRKETWHLVKKHTHCPPLHPPGRGRFPLTRTAGLLTHQDRNQAATQSPRLRRRKGGPWDLLGCLLTVRNRIQSFVIARD